MDRGNWSTSPAFFALVLSFPWLATNFFYRFECFPLPSRRHHIKKEGALAFGAHALGLDCETGTGQFANFSPEFVSFKRDNLRIPYIQKNAKFQSFCRSDLLTRML